MLRYGRMAGLVKLRRGCDVVGRRRFGPLVPGAGKRAYRHTRSSGSEMLVFGLELKDAALPFPQVLTVDWVKGIRRSTLFIVRQTKLT